MKKFLKLGLLVLAASIIFGAGQAVAQRQTSIYFDQSGDRMVVASGGTVLAESGGTVQIESGGTLQVDSGATFTMASSGYPLLTSATEKGFVCGSAAFTGTTVIATGLTTATYGIATLVTDPGATAGDPFLVTVDAPTTSTLTVNTWQDDASVVTSTATVHWCAYGDN